MGELTSLFSQYSLESIILFIVAIGVCIKIVSELWEFFYKKIRDHFNLKSNKDRQHEDIMESVNNLADKISSLDESITNINSELQMVHIQLENNTERLQENTRSYIIDKHHYFVYELKAIDDANLSSLERRYLFYKSAGGDSYIDGLMEELRSLPRIALIGHGAVNPIQTNEL